ncbi:uncharacterized protein LOC133544972 isoform X2 [Nerophis ophidion]|uniref:uncharacterized protein LOC133544972 isoform X2 n=1 Tax=Nerophis ophidion TaxID=159077 RepID=UPI002ADFA466|nr:uncharacterized protein LOC133544972 isoform X2 [Nerophis ophidion]
MLAFPVTGVPVTSEDDEVKGESEEKREEVPPSSAANTSSHRLWDSDDSEEDPGNGDLASLGLASQLHRQTPPSRRVPARVISTGTRQPNSSTGDNFRAPHHGEGPAPALNMQRVTQGTAVPPRLPPPKAPALNMWQTEEPGSRLAYRPTWRGGRMADNISCSAAEVQIFRLLETMKHTQDQLMAKVNFLTSRLTSTPGPEVEMPANIQFPLEQLEAVEAFEALLKEPSNGPARQRVISSLATIGGQDVKRVTWNILGRIFTDEVSHQINWKGVNNKKAFSRMATKTLLFSAVRKNVETRSATDAEVTKHAIRWFNLAADRAARRRVPPPPPQTDQEE